MKRSPIALGTLLSIAILMAGCGWFAKSPAGPEVALCATSSGAGVTLFPVFDVSGPARLAPKSSQVVTLAAPSQEINPWTFFSGGEFGIVLEEKDNQVTQSTVYGGYRYETVTASDGRRTVPVFTRRGPGEKAIGSDSGQVWSLYGGVRQPIGEMSYQNVVLPDGTKRTERMARWQGANEKWIASLGDKIMALGPDAKLSQIGWVSWRKITPPGGKPLAILMTKSMAKDAKWAGRYDGKLYRDK